MFIKNLRHRLSLCLIYIVMVLLPIFLIARAYYLPTFMKVFLLHAYALPFFITWHLDRFFWDGGGFHSLKVFLLFTSLNLTLLWPLPFLAIRPASWQNKKIRKSMLVYASILIILCLIAAIWMIFHIHWFLG